MINNIDSLFSEFDDMEPGCSVLVGNMNGVIYSRSFGLASMEYNMPVDHCSIFNIASISKPITALGIMLLVEKGLIGLEDSFIEYFPEFEKTYGNIRLKHLLNHTSGIKNYYDILREQNRTSSGFSNIDFFRLMVKNPYLNFEPGQEFEYSNSGYVFLSLLIEKVTGSSYTCFMDSSFFRPLGMTNTFINTEKRPIIPGLAYGYKPAGENYCCDYTSTYTLGDGGILSTTHDIYTLMKEFLKGNIISAYSRNLMTSAGYTDEGIRIPYGYGWEIKPDGPSNVIYHSGLDAGYRNLLTIDTCRNVIVVLLSNNARFSYAKRVEITSEILKAI